jgi:hypothetical protein
VIEVTNNAVIKRTISLTKTTFERKSKLKQQHICLDKAYNFKQVEQEIIRRGYVPHIPYLRKREEKKEAVEKPCHKTYSENMDSRKNKLVA